MKVLLLLFVAVTCYSQSPPPPGGGGTNTIPPSVRIPKPVVLVDGLITNVALDRIDWCAWSPNAYNVYHTGALGAPWTNIALEVRSYTHNAPEGFYRVARDVETAVFPVWNSGTTNMNWIATTDCTWLEFVSDLGFDVLPETGEGFLIVRTHNPPETWEVGVITITAGTSGEALNQSGQVTVVINNPLGL